MVYKTSDVWFDDANYKDVSGIATLTGEEEEIDAELDRGRTTLKKLVLNEQVLEFGQSQNLLNLINAQEQVNK